VAHPDVFEVVALLDVPERFVALPAGKIDLHDAPYTFFGLEGYRATGQEHHRLFAKPFYHDEIQGIPPPRKLYGKSIVGDGGLLFFPSSYLMMAVS